MSALVGYASSDDEEQEKTQHQRVKENGTSELQALDSSNREIEPSSRPHYAIPAQTPLLGPSAGPSAQPLHDDGEPGAIEGGPATRQQLLHSLTLPPIPNVSIPPSPPGSPMPSATAKVNRFLELKSKGVHFNDKLSSSSKIRNPNLLPNLMEYAGIDQHYDQYATTLSDDVAVLPKGGFPKGAYVEELGKQQQQMTTKKAEERKKPGGLEFVSSGFTRGGNTPDTSSAAVQTSRKTRFDDTGR